MNARKKSVPTAAKARHVKRRIFLHVGQHKTGTTSIQWAMWCSRENLRKKGWLYPASGSPDWARYGQHLLPWSLVENADFLPFFNGQRPIFGDQVREALWRDLIAEIEGSEAHSIIISSEEFDILRRNEINALVTRISAYDIIPVIFLRNYADFVESAYRTSVVYSQYSGDLRKLAETQRSRLDYVQMIRDWSSVSSSGKAVVVSYDDERVRKDSVGTFLDIIGLEPDVLTERAHQRQNESRPAYVCEIIRFLRLKGVSEKDIGIWLARTTRLLAGHRDSVEYTCLQPALRTELNERYVDEVHTIVEDSALKPMVRGALGASVSGRKLVPVRHVADAMLFLAKEAGGGALGEIRARAEDHPRPRGPVWKSDTDFEVGRLNFRCLLGDYHAEQTTPERVIILKSREVLSRYFDMLANEPIRKVFEFGIFQGGSALMFTEALGLEKLVALDFSKPIPALDELITRYDLTNRIRLQYEISQTDRKAVVRLLDAHFNPGEIDMIIDDASHFYEHTKISFETAFPYLRSGGLYVIEDWGWAHWGGYWQSAEARWQDRPALSNLIFELSMVAASSPQLISEVRIFPSFVSVRKAYAATPGTPFSLSGAYAARGKRLQLI